MRLPALGKLAAFTVPTALLIGCSGGSQNYDNPAQLIADAKDAGLECVDARPDYAPEFASSDRYESVACGHAGDDPSSSYYDFPSVGMYVGPPNSELTPTFCEVVKERVNSGQDLSMTRGVSTATAIVGTNWIIAEETNQSLSPAVDTQAVADDTGGEVTTVAALCGI